MADGPGRVIWELLNGATVAHVLHLRSESYAQHVALGDLYEKLTELGDDLAETYQGCYGLIDDWPSKFEVAFTQPKKWLEGFSRMFQDQRKLMGDDSELQNICDEIQAEIDKALYKITFLK